MSDILYHATTISELRARTLKVGDVFTLLVDSQFARSEQKPSSASNGVPCFIEATMKMPEEAGDEFLLLEGTSLVVTAVRLKMSESQDNTVDSLRLKVREKEDDTGSWFTTDTGVHVYVEPGQSKSAALKQKVQALRGKKSPELDWEDPPSPGKGRDPKVKGGMTASGETNTKIGDLGENLLVQQMGMQSLIPKGQRQNPLDARWDGSKEAYEIKTITTDAKEFKIKMKAAEVESKLAYAKAHGYKAGMIMLVIDRKSNTGYAYKRDGIGNYRLNDKEWKFMGRIHVKK